ncbi:pyridoxamine kinase [Streptococcus canis]|uniref:pyridoxamine kinase n=1 Tax=Streptococcus canis TaxID=1329 RepID=UPI000C1BD294|nr:pyridoxamine kinase [Streptococcus canis]GAY70423.1 pyridoxine kinase [Streptococcus canis]
MKRIIVANDLVGLGKVALSASIPLMAACCMEQVLLPTCLFSSHTGGGQTPLKHSTSTFLDGFLLAWEQSDLKFDSLFVGYLNQVEDANKILAFVSRQNMPLVLDPIMADQGRLYSGLSEQHLKAMRSLAQKADLILPNITEACLLTQPPYLKEGYRRSDIKELAIKLTNLGPKEAIISGVSFEEGQIGFAYYQAAHNQLTYHFGKQFPEHFYGTGDIASAIIASGFSYQLPLGDILELTVSFLEKSLETTLDLKRNIAFGIAYEFHLAYLITSFQQLLEENHDISKISSSH